MRDGFQRQAVTADEVLENGSIRKRKTSQTGGRSRPQHLNWLNTTHNSHLRIWLTTWELGSLRRHAGCAELLALPFHERGVLSHVDLAGYHEVKLAGMVPEKLAMDPGPNEPPVCADIDLGNSEADHRFQFGRGDPAGTVDPATRLVDALDLLNRHGGSTVQHNGKPASRR